MTTLKTELLPGAYLHLAQAVLLRAVLDASSDIDGLSQEARAWLADEGLLYCQGLEIDTCALLEWLARECPNTGLAQEGAPAAPPGVE